MKAINSLKILLAPFLPFTSERLQTTLGYDRPIFGEQIVKRVSDTLGVHDVLCYVPERASGRWAPSDLQPGQPLQKPKPLFKKLDASIAESERARLGVP